MTRREAERLTMQADTLRSLGFTREEAEQLRRISMTLHRWHELECGTDSECLVRGRMKDGDFEYDDNGDAYMERAGVSGRNRYYKVQDREKGAIKRLRAIVASVNVQRAGKVGPLTTYIQGDPRGAALYILRPGDVPEGQRADAYYTRGICVY